MPIKTHRAPAGLITDIRYMRKLHIADIIFINKLQLADIRYMLKLQIEDISYMTKCLANAGTPGTATLQHIQECREYHHFFYPDRTPKKREENGQIKT